MIGHCRSVQVPWAAIASVAGQIAHVVQLSQLEHQADDPGRQGAPLIISRAGQFVHLRVYDRASPRFLPSRRILAEAFSANIIDCRYNEIIGN
jgi:hypothetical protein